MAHYSPKLVAQAIGVSEASLKRWCDRGLLGFVKTAGGHRRIPREEVLQFLRTSGHPLLHPEILAPDRNDLAALDQRTPKMSVPETLKIERVIELLKSGDDLQLRQLMINQLRAGASMLELCESVLAPSFEAVGTCWEEGSLAIYEERRGCEICQGILYEILTLLPLPEANAPSAIGATLRGNTYTLANLMVQIVLRELGWSARSYGTDLPGESLATAIYKERPQLFWLSISVVPNEAELIEACHLIWQACRETNCLLVVGGRALTPSLRRNLSYSAYCDGFKDLANFLEATGHNRRNESGHQT